MVFHGILLIGGVSGRVTPVQLIDYENQWGLAFERPEDGCLSGTLYHVQRGCKVRLGDRTWLITRAIQSVIHSNQVKYFMKRNVQVLDGFENEIVFVMEK